MSQQDGATSFMQYRNMQQEQRETPPFKKAIRPAGFRNEDGIERPRETGNYVRLAMNSYPGPTIRGNVGYNSDWEAQRAHTQYVRLYNQQLRNIPQRRPIRWEIPRAPGPPNRCCILHFHGL